MKSKLVAIMHSVLSAYSSALRIVYFNVFLMNEEISMYMIPCLFFYSQITKRKKQAGDEVCTQKNRAKITQSYMLPSFTLCHEKTIIIDIFCMLKST